MQLYKLHIYIRAHIPTNGTSCHAHFAGADTKVPRNDCAHSQEEAALSLGSILGTQFQDNQSPPPSISTMRWTQMDAEPTTLPHSPGDTCQSTQGRWAVDSTASVCHSCFVACGHFLPTLGSGIKQRVFPSDPRPLPGWEERRDGH